MKQMEIGMRIPIKGGPKFFGLDQVNAALKAVHRLFQSMKAPRLSVEAPKT
jgi:hypothetical protein